MVAPLKKVGDELTQLEERAGIAKKVEEAPSPCPRKRINQLLRKHKPLVCRLGTRQEVRQLGKGIRGVIALGAVLLAPCPGASAADLTVDWNLARNYSSVKRMVGGRENVAMYLMGAGSAYMLANANAVGRNQPQLYCQPPTLVLNALNYLDIFEKELERGQPEVILKGQSFFSSAPALATPRVGRLTPWAQLT